MATNTRDNDDSTVTREAGNAKYTGPATGLDCTGNSQRDMSENEVEEDEEDEREYEEIRDAIIEAVEHDVIGGEPVDYSDAETVAEEAVVQRDEVLRIWRDAGVDFELHPDTKLDWDDLPRERQEALAYCYHTDGIGNFETTEYSYDDVAEIVDLPNSVVSSVANRRGWMLKDAYRPSWVDDDAGKYDLAKSADAADESSGHEAYESLNPRQQTFVDVVAELIVEGKNPHTEKVVERMSDSHVKSYTVNTVYKYLDKFSGVIDDRVQLLANSRNEHAGDVVTEGEIDLEETLSQINGDDDSGADDAEVEESMEETKPGSELVSITLELTEEQLFELIRSGQEDIAWEVYRQVM